MKSSHPPTCILVLGLALILARLEGASLAEPVDEPYPGTLTLSVDLTDSARKILRVRETIPVKAGALALHYPEWIPGHHRPTDSLGGVTGVKFSTTGRA